MSKKLSIIVPVYNVESYLRECLCSLYDQRLSLDQFEVIIVNDGSTDGSLQIAKEFTDLYQNILLIDQTNKGLGYARNVGLDQSNGEYILFVDSDDYLFKDSLFTIIMDLDKIDMLAYKVRSVGLSDKLYTQKGLPYGKTISGDSFLSRITPQAIVQSYIYRRLWLNDNSIRMPEGILHEDELFIPLSISKAQSIKFVDKEVYAYRVREGSITTKRSMVHLELSMRDRLVVISCLCDYCREIQDNSLKRGIKRKISFLTIDVIRLLYRYNFPIDRREFYLLQLRDLGIFPLKLRLYSLKYLFFALLVNNNYIRKAVERTPFPTFF